MFQISNVSKSFNKNKVLKNINYSFPDTGFISIFGKSGSGKSTLLNLLFFLLKPDEGAISFNGKNTTKLKQKEIQIIRTNQIGFLFQSYNLFDELTVAENLLIPLYLNGSKKKDALLKIKASLESLGMEKYIDQKVSQLSGGEKQRISFLRAVINNPKVILTDEPTGALDNANSELLMKNLKDCSKQKLILNVSHNIDLSNKYSDETVLIKDGKIETTCKRKYYYHKKENLNEIKRNNSWKNFFTKLFIKKHIVRNIALTMSATFSLAFIQIFAGFFSNAQNSIYVAQQQTLNYTYSTVAYKEEVKIENSSLTLTKVSRPELDDLESLKKSVPSITFDINYSSIFPQYPPFSFAKNFYESIEFIPLYNLTDQAYQPLLIKGNIPTNNDLEYVIVNNEFIKETKFDIAKIIGEEISIFCNIETYYKKLNKSNPIKDNFEIKRELIVSGVVEEFSYMNTPKVYFSNQGMLDYLSTIQLKNVSEKLQKNFSVLDLIEEAESTDQYSSFCLNCFIKNKDEVPKLFDFIKANETNNVGIEITSESFTLGESFKNLTTLFESSMIAFAIIAVIGSILIIGIISFSCFVEEKKSSAILTCLGSPRFSIISIFSKESMIFSSIGFVLSFGLAYLIQFLLNSKLKSFFGIKEMIQIPFNSFFGIPFFIPIILLVGTLVISFLASYLPITVYKKFNLIEELREE